MARGANRETVRRGNLATVLDHVHRAGELSRAALTASTGLNRSTVGALVGELVARGLVEERDAVPTGGPGRPSSVVEPSARAVVLAVDLQARAVTCAVACLGGVVLARSTAPVDTAARAPETVVAAVARLARRLVSELGVDQRLVAVGVAVPGVTRTSDGTVHVAPNLGWRDVALADAIAAAAQLGVPVLVANEADLGARAEHVRGAGVGADDLVYVHSDTGIGGGVIIGGRPLTGADGYAGEVGHVPVDPHGEPCRCGGRGCWETVASERAVLRTLGRTVDDEHEGVGAVLREAAAGSRRALDALDELGAWLGIGLAVLVNTFNPSRVILGGLFRRAHPYTAHAMFRELERRALAPARSSVTVVTGALGDDAALLGAAELALGSLLDDPSSFDLDTEPAPAPAPDRPADALVAGASR